MTFTALTVSVSYALATPESAEHGDYAEIGMMFGHGDLAFTFRMPIEECDGVIETDVAMRAHDALRLIRQKHCCYSANVMHTTRGLMSASFYSAEPQDTSHRTGETHEETVHVTGPARLVRALIKAAAPRHVFG